MHERPQAALFSALRKLGYRVESENGNDKLPVKIFGEVGSRVRRPDAAARRLTNSCKVSIEESSQFASALLLCAKVGNWKVEVVGENAEESPYVAMTLKLMEAFPKNGGNFKSSRMRAAEVIFGRQIGFDRRNRERKRFLRLTEIY